MLDNITLTGITPLENYPDCCSNKNCKQNIQQLSLSIPCQKPEMESINDIKITLCIKAFKILNTILGRKVLINGVSKVKAIYTAKNKEQSLHSAHWDIDFCDFILLEDICYDDCNISLCNFFIGLENICINSCDERNISLSLLYIICANFNNCSHYTDYSYKHYDKFCDNDYKKNYTYMEDKNNFNFKNNKNDFSSNHNEHNFCNKISIDLNK
ncbi:MAG: SPOCS domain-containing protein [Paraclostridium bifermentans]